MGFLPVSRLDMEVLGWSEVDFVLVTGDAYVDHPSFGVAIIARVLENSGYKIAVLSQPDWRSPDDFRRFGRPRLGFMITAGCVDSMVNNYSVTKSRRKRDVYSPRGESGRRPDRAVIAYSNRAKQAYKDAPVILGGLEASLRRMGHYDYWDDRVRRSVLLDSKADILIYGMGEKGVLEVASALNDGFSARDITWVRGTVFRTSEIPQDAVVLPGFDALKDKRSYAESFRLQYENTDSVTASSLAEKYAEGLYIVQNPPQPPLSQAEMDAVYELPYMGEPHPTCGSEGGVPAATEIMFSLTACRGCFGGCAFCALTAHQGRVVTGRSKASLLREAEKLTKRTDFKGYIHDVGGPTANFRKAACKKQEEYGVCKHRDCLFPEPCHMLDIDHREYTDILKTIRAIPGIKKVFIRSGIRYDYLMADKNRAEFIRELCDCHVSGILKVAPEHISDDVLKLMRKPGKRVYEKFAREYNECNRKLSKEQYLLPYFMSSHPGSALNDAVELAIYLKKSGFTPEQTQDFYPTPGTIAACMYYTGIDPITGEAVYVASDADEKRMQHALLHYDKPQNRKLVMRALELAGRQDAARILFPSAGSAINRRSQRPRV